VPEHYTFIASVNAVPDPGWPYNIAKPPRQLIGSKDNWPLIIEALETWIQKDCLFYVFKQLLGGGSPVWCDRLCVLKIGG
jgi:hypothetical protein